MCVVEKRARCARCRGYSYPSTSPNDPEARTQFPETFRQYYFTTAPNRNTMPGTRTATSLVRMRSFLDDFVSGVPSPSFLFFSFLFFPFQLPYIPSRRRMLCK
jgi:hypothetical protein